MSSTSAHRLRVYTVVERADAPSFWLRLGNAVAHKDGKGFSMTLQALPVTGLVVVRQYDDEADQTTPLDTQLHEQPPDLGEH